MKIMTRKEWMKENHPELVGDKYVGGVNGCPYVFAELSYNEGECLAFEHDHREEGCEVCWNQKIALYDDVPKKGLWQRIKEAFIELVRG